MSTKERALHTVPSSTAYFISILKELHRANAVHFNAVFFTAVYDESTQQRGNMPDQCCLMNCHNLPTAIEDPINSLIAVQKLLPSGTTPLKWRQRSISGSSGGNLVPGEGCCTPANKVYYCSPKHSSSRLLMHVFVCLGTSTESARW